jgi:hypothetical protein
MCFEERYLVENTDDKFSLFRKKHIVLHVDCGISLGPSEHRDSESSHAYMVACMPAYLKQAYIQACKITKKHVRHAKVETCSCAGPSLRVDGGGGGHKQVSHPQSNISANLKPCSKRI